MAVSREGVNLSLGVCRRQENFIGFVMFCLSVMMAISRRLLSKSRFNFGKNGKKRVDRSEGRTTKNFKTLRARAIEGYSQTRNWKCINFAMGPEN